MKGISVLKQKKCVFILSDGTCYSEFIVFSQHMSSSKKYTLLSQDLHDHRFWVNNSYKTNFSNSYELLDFVSTRIR